MKRTETAHRLKEVRLRAGLSLRTISRRTKLSVGKLRQQEVSNDIGFLDLCRWRDALDVPWSELLNDTPEKLVELHRLRAGLVHIMRGVQSLLTTELDEAQQAFVKNMESKLQMLMPELEGLRGWPIYGERRSCNEPTRIESHMITTSVWFPDTPHEA